MIVREAQDQDSAAIRQVVTAAFEQEEEADLIDALHAQADPLISLVAEDNEIVGHILFTPMTFPGHEELKLMGLAPMAVVPGRQKQGIGGALIAAGLERCRAMNMDGVVVLGHPE